MQNNDFSPIIILALNTDTGIEQEVNALVDAGFDTVRAVKGCYKGETENSYLVNGDLELALAVARDHGQESVLYLDNQRNGFLVYCDDESREHVGTFKQVSKTTAETLNAYTFDPKAVKYYACV